MPRCSHQKTSRPWFAEAPALWPEVLCELPQLSLGEPEPAVGRVDWHCILRMRGQSPSTHPSAGWQNTHRPWRVACKPAPDQPRLVGSSLRPCTSCRLRTGLYHLESICSRANGGSGAMVGASTLRQTPASVYRTHIPPRRLVCIEQAGQDGSPVTMPGYLPH